MRLRSVFKMRMSILNTATTEQMGYGIFSFFVYTKFTNQKLSFYIFQSFILSTSIVVVLCLLLSFPLETIFMKVIFREMMLQSFSGWIALYIAPEIYVKMFLIGIISYAAVALLEYRKIRKVPMDEALKNVEW